MIALVLAHMLDRPIPVVLNTALIAFAGALLLTLASLSSHLTTRLQRDMADIDLVVSAKGSPLQVILSSLFHVDVPTGNIALKTANAIAKDPLVSQAVPIAVGDRFRGFRVVGTTPEYLGLYQAAASLGTMSIQDGNAIIGAAVARSLGMDIGQQFTITHGLSGSASAGHDAHPLTVAAILEPTASVLDRLIVTSLEAVWQAHGIESGGIEAGGIEAGGIEAGGIEAGDHGETQHEDDHVDHNDHISGGGREPEITALLIRYASSLAAVQLPRKINQRTQLMAAVPAYETARLLGLFGASQSAARLLTTALALLGAFAIFTSLWSALEGREADMALYRLMGAQPRHIFWLLLFEGAFTATLGAIAAWLIARLCLWQLVAASQTLADSGFSPLMTSTPEQAILVGIVVIGALAAVPAAIKASRVPLERALA